MSLGFTCPFCGDIHAGNPAGEPRRFTCLGEFYLDYSGCENYIRQEWTDVSTHQIAWAKIAFEAAHKSIFHTRIPYTGAPKIDFESVLKNLDLPNPAQQADWVIEYVGKKTRVLGGQLEINPPGHGGGYPQLRAWIGGADEKAVQRIFEYLVEQKLLREYKNQNYEQFKLELTPAGWKRFADLQEVNKESKQAFMAMKFDDEQKQFVNDKLKPVVKETGFDLLLLTDINSKENLIDNKLRVAIRQSRFLICDLTHCNAGAYWEAGYAEGLKLPVIYICEKSAFDDEDKTKRPHFDVNHQEIFQWDKNNEESIKDFLDNIKAKIQIMIE